MSDKNLPVPTGDPERRRLAALAASALRFRRNTQDAIDTLTLDMIENNTPLDGIKFRTPNGRNAMLVLAIGDDAVGSLTDALNDLLEQSE